ncbi:hypothetical protein LEN26_009009 [Aphanomyces euteiches]|nr:hypothetical protein LEN26_009009 [Aphanomyces euteiches]KAH9191016.1 hypothetical protein AeNC1_007008 [Aphanomyces euteiches]
MLEKTPFDVVGKKRDFCCLELSHIILDENGRRAFVNSAASFQSPCCPEFPNVIRAVHFGSGIICRDSARPGYVELMLIAHCDLRGILPNAIKERTAMDLCRTIQTIDRNLRQDRLTGTPFLTGDQLVERSSRQQCKLCERKFCFFRQKKNCFKCGEVVCTQCGPKWDVRVEGTLVKVRACTTTSTITTPSSLSSTDVWNLADGDDSDDDDDDDDEFSFVSFITDSSMSHYSVSTGGRPTFDHSL